LFPILERVTELETNIKSLQTELREQEDEANDVISQWQNNCAAAELKFSTIEEELDEIKISKISDVAIGDTSVPVDQTLVDALAKKEDELRKAHEDAESNKHSIQELKGMLCRIITPHVRHSLVFYYLMSYYFSNSNFSSFFSLDQVTSLESRIKELQNEVSDEEAERNDANLELKESLDLSEKKCFQLQKDIEEAVATKEGELQQLRELLNDNSKSQEQNEGKPAVHKFAMTEVYAIEFSNSCNFFPTDRIQELSHQIESIKKEFGNEQLEANNAIEQLEKKFTESEKENTLLRDKLEEAKSNCDELQALRNTLSNDDQIVHQWEERANKLTDSVAVLEDQLKEQEQEACDAIAQWQVTCSDLEMKCSNLEFEVKNSRETVSIRSWSIEQLMSRNDSYCAHIKQLKSASLKFESSVNANLFSATTEIATLNEVLEAERKNRADERKQLQAKIAGEKENNHEARDEIETLTSSLEEIKIESEDTLNRWTGK
jgi:DNA repair exonuclease SbcCD ATPase subunit